MKKELILVLITILLALSPLIAAYGEITKSVIDSETTDTDRVYGKHTICQVNSSNYYLTVRDDGTWDNILETWQVNTANGTVNLVDSVSKTAASYAGSVCHRPGSDIYLTVYGDKPYIVSYSVNDQTGDIINSNIDSLDTGSVDREDYTIIKHLTGDMFVSLGVPSAKNQVFLRTFNCTKEGVLTDYGSETFITSRHRSNMHDIVVIDTDTIAVATLESDGTGHDLMTFNVSSQGIFTMYGNITLDTGSEDANAVQASYKTDGNLFIFNTEAFDGTFFARSHIIDNNGQIHAQADVNDYDNTGTAGALHPVGPGVMATVHENTSGMVLITFNYTIDNGTMYVDHGEYWFTTSGYTLNMDLIRVSSTHYAVWSGYGIHILEINSPTPTVTSTWPIDGATDIARYPHPRATVSHPRGSLMNVSFAVNSSGSWDILVTNSSVSNGTYYFNHTGANEYNERYHWRVFIDDGFVNVSYDYYFDAEGFSFGTISFYGTDAGDHIHLTWTMPDAADWALLTYLGATLTNETVASSYDHYVTMSATYTYTLYVWNATYNGFNTSTVQVAFTFPGEVGDLGVADESWGYIIIGIIVLLGFLLPNIIVYTQKRYYRHPNLIINIFTGFLTVAGLIVFGVLPLATLLLLSFLLVIYIIYKIRKS